MGEEERKKKGASESGAELGGVILRDFVVPYQNGSFFRGGATLHPARRDRALVGCFDSALLYLLPDQGSSDLTNRDPDSSFGAIPHSFNGFGFRRPFALLNVCPVPILFYLIAILNVISFPVVLNLPFHFNKQHSLPPQQIQKDCRAGGKGSPTQSEKSGGPALKKPPCPGRQLRIVSNNNNNNNTMKMASGFFQVKMLLSFQHDLLGLHRKTESTFCYNKVFKVWY